MADSLLEHALHYASLGLSVVPVHTVRSGRCSCDNAKCESPGKHPRLKWRGQSKAALDDGDLRQWWKKHPDSNIGIVTGRVSDLLVIDIDDSSGVAALRKIGIDIDKIVVPVVQTGGGGLHLYCKYPEDDHGISTRSGVLPKVDIRAEGGLIIAPPSLHASGRRYAWVEEMSLSDADLGDFNMDWARSGNGKGTSQEAKAARVENWFEQVLQGVAEGARNDLAARLAGRYLGLGMTSVETLFLLEHWNQNNDPPMARRELETIVGSIASLEDARPSQLAREEALKKISKALKLELRDIRRITGDDPQYILVFREGTCQMDTKSVLSPPLFQSAVAEATKIVVRRLSEKTYPRQSELSQWIMDASRDEDAGVEATFYGEIEGLMHDYLGAQRITVVESGKGVPSRGCFRYGKRNSVWIGLSEFISWSGTKGARLSIRQTAQTLTALGWNKRSFDTDVDTIRSAWSTEKNDD